MPSIKILPESLANQIAAGEVIERPASVVKELIENAVDAEARRIEVEISGGGQKIIRITDNGTGMDRQDTLLCLERHATSKITGNNDLLNISTLGFRGEALPSIASVSKMTVVSKKKGESSGYRVYAEFGKIKEITEIGCAEGTTIEIEDLFENVPARRKFLKSSNVETGHIQDCLEQMALADFGIQFILRNEGRVTFSASAGDRLKDRLASVLRFDKTGDLLQVEEVEDHIGLSGLIGEPQVNRSSFKSLFLFVNRRFVRDRIIFHAVLQGYEGFLMKGRYPVGALYIDLPPSDVDVNVHPAKREIRFRSPQAIHRVVYKGIRKALLAKQVIGPFTEPQGLEVCQIVGIGRSEDSGSSSLSEPQTPLSWHEEVSAYFPAIQATEAPEAQKTNLLPPHKWRLIGQLAKSYLLCQSDDGLVIVDQHAAHERILFEKLKTDLVEGSVETQRLLFPITLDMTRIEADMVSRHLEDFSRLGIELAPFGGNTFAVRTIPAVLGDKDTKGLVESMLVPMASSESFLDDSLLQGTLALIACHGAIKANQVLTPEEMDCLLYQLVCCEISSNCPHGRPIWRLYRYDEIEKDFKRK